LIENLDGARVQTARARAYEILARTPLNDGDIDACERQLARQHQPRWTSSSDHYGMLGHRGTPTPDIFSALGRQQLGIPHLSICKRLYGTARLLLQAPPCAICW
jgi:hypothetical protein